jgi:hypothetical protein
MENWYFTRGGEQVGPHSTEQLRQFLVAGQLNAGNVVWKDGMPQWVALGSLPEFADLAPAQAAAPSTLNYAMPAAPAGSGVLATRVSLDMLRQTKPWVRLISIVMLVGAGLMLILGILMVGLSATNNTPFGAGQAFLMIGLSAIYIIPAYFLSQYASAIGKLNVSRRDGDLETALRCQKSFWKFSGILTIIVICFYAIVFLLAAMLGTRFLR